MKKLSFRVASRLVPTLLIGKEALFAKVIVFTLGTTSREVNKFLCEVMFFVAQCQSTRDCLKIQPYLQYHEKKDHKRIVQY